MSKTKFITVLITVLIGIIGHSSVHAAGLAIPSGHTVNVNTSTVNVSGDVGNDGTLQTSTGAISLNGNWSNLGSFVSGTGTVTLNSSTNAQSVQTGGATSAFNILSVLNTYTSGVTFDDELHCDTLNATPGVQKLSFDNFGMHTITSTFNVNGSSGNPITLAPLAVSTDWSLDAPSSTVNYLNVSHSQEIAGKLILTCNSFDGGNNTNWLFVSCSGGNAFPTADAGADQDIYLSETAQLNGINSDDPDGDIVSHTWTIDSAPASSTATLSDPSAIDPILEPDLIGSYLISLVVSDGVLYSAADTVIVNVTLNLPPVAFATGLPVTGEAPHTVNFDASGSSDPELGNLTFDWDFGDPATEADVSTLEDPTYIYNNVGNYTAVVTVTDDFNNTDQASVEIVVTAPNMPPTVAPTATIDDFTVEFMANANDPNVGDILTYIWDFGDSTALSSDANPTHIYNDPDTYTATVTVSDGEFDVSAKVVVSVFSSLEVDVFEAKVNSGKKGKVKGRVNLKAFFCFDGLPLPSDIIKVDFDGITLIEEPFGSFVEKVNKPGIFKYKEKNLHAKIDINKSMIKVSRHKILLNGLDNSNGVDVFISFGLSTGSENILMKQKHGGDDDSSDDGHKKKWSYKEKHHHANCDGGGGGCVPPCGGL